MSDEQNVGRGERLMWYIDPQRNKRFKEYIESNDHRKGVTTGKDLAWGYLSTQEDAVKLYQYIIALTKKHEEFVRKHGVVVIGADVETERAKLLSQC